MKFFIGLFLLCVFSISCFASISESKKGLSHFDTDRVILAVAVGPDETTAITTGNTKMSAPLADNVKFTKAIIFCTTAPTYNVDALSVDINLNGTTILNGDLEVPSGSHTAVTTNFAVETGSLLDVISIDVPTISTGNAGAGLKVILRGLIQ